VSAVEVVSVVMAVNTSLSCRLVPRRSVRRGPSGAVSRVVTSHGT